MAKEFIKHKMGMSYAVNGTKINLKAKAPKSCLMELFMKVFFLIL